MNYLLPTEEIIYTVSDLTAGTFLVILIISITLQVEKRRNPVHLLAAVIMELTGILLRLLASTVEKLPAGFMWNKETHILTPIVPQVIWILSFVFIAIGITESATYVIYISGGKDKSSFGVRSVATGIIVAVGIILYACTGNLRAFTFDIMALFVCLLIHIYRCCSVSVMCQFGRASLSAIITYLIRMVIEPVGLTGLGLSVMLLIINEQDHGHLGLVLAENEAALARGKVQLLADQISPHYIYNSLQSIRGLCETNPGKARDALDAFSEYLRGNLESLTVEELIPFERELETTQAYLELERICGLYLFDVEYKLDVIDFMLPPLVLQPVVENALKHGAARTKSGMDSKGGAATRITVATRKQEDHVVIVVIDSTEELVTGATDAALMGNDIGVSAHEETQKKAEKNSKKRKSVGLDNVRTRLKLQCGGFLELESTYSGNKTTIILPVSPQVKT